MSDFKKYRRKGLSEMRPYVEDEALSNKVSISEADRKNGSPKVGDMIARNPKNHEDQWLVAKKYFEENLEEDRGPLKQLWFNLKQLWFKLFPVYIQTELMLCSLDQANMLMGMSEGHAEEERWILATKENKKASLGIDTGMVYIQRRKQINK